MLATWLVWYPPSPDLAAQTYRVHLFSIDGFSLWDNSWYAGHYIPSYSLLFPALGATLGLRLTGALAVCCSVWAFRSLLAERGGLRVNLATAVFASGALGDLFIGRVTFAVGVSLGLLSALALARGRHWSCAAFSLGCAAISPVAAAFLVLVASGDLLAARSARRFAVLAGPALALGAVTLALFPEQGYEPFGLGSLLAALGAGGGVLLLAPPSERLIRCTALLYVLALLVDYVVRSPMGSNAVRFGILFAPTALAACVKGEDLKRVTVWARRRSRSQQVTSHAAAGGRVHSALVTMVGAALVLWQVNGPIAQSVGAADDPTSHASFYSPVITYLDRRAAGAPMRIEVPFTKSHWDATILGDRFALARGWDRQLDTSDNAIFYERRLTAPVYRAWLSENAVRFVALSDASLDFSSVQEAALIRAGLPFLRQVFAGRNWHVYEVLGSAPLASGADTLTALDGDGFSLRAEHAGASIVRVRFTPYWTVTSGLATVSRAPGGWTLVDAKVPGGIAIDAEFLPAL
ncbi:MAG TPA: hypothetical protein VHT25_10895 [Solirubrobacteraceae bacterium]|nr:hypothetical protein [Solirubrobacteraceae bacterium]